MALWAEPTEQSEDFEWVSRRLNASGLPGTSQRLGAAPPGLRLVRLRPTRDGGVLAVAAAEHDGRHQLLSLVLRPDGSMTNAPHQLDTDGNRTLWLDSIATASGSLALWAEHQGTQAALYALALTEDGQARHPLTRLYTDAIAWQAVEMPQGALVAVTGRDGVVRAFTVDADGQPGATTVIEEQGRAHHDLDMVREPGAEAVVVVYSRTRLLEPELFSARVAASGALLDAPQRLTAPLGPHALWGVWTTGEQSYVAWEHAVQAPGQLNLAPLEGTRAAQAVVVLDHASAAKERLAPTFSTHARGLAVVAQACLDRRCEQHHWPTLLKFDLHLQLQSSTQLTAGGAPLDAVWDLTCSEHRCVALGARYTEPPQIWVQQEGEPENSRLPPQRPNTTRGVQIRSLQALAARDDPLASVSAIQTDGGVLLASLSDFDPNLPYERPQTPAPDGRLAPVRAQLQVQYLPNHETPFIRNSEFGELESISIRARSVAGVDLAMHERQALLAWTAIDNQHPQLFLTVVSDRGRRLRQSMLTKQSGEILALRAATQDTGWAVAWIDDRQGSPQIYTARVNRTLRRLNPDTPLTGADGDATGLDLQAAPDGVWVLSTHVVQQAKQSRVLLSQLDGRTLRPLATGLVLGEAAGRASNPRLELVQDGTLVVAWLQAESEGSALRWQKLSRDGSIQGAVTEVRLDGEASSLRLGCSARCVALVGVRRGSEASLELVELEGTSSASRIRLLAPSAAGVAPALVGNQAYFFDQREGVSAVHRALLAL